MLVKPLTPHRLMLLLGAFLLGWMAAGNHTALSLTIDRIVAIVNEETITLSELQEEALLRHKQEENAAPPQTNPLDKENLRLILNDMITKKLQLQEAHRKGLSVSEDELRFKIEEIKQNNGFPDDGALKQALGQKSITFDQYKEDLRQQLIIFKLINREISSGIFIEEEELKSYYKEHRNRYKLPVRIKLRQILLVPSPGVDDREVERLAKEMVERLREGADFAKMAMEYSSGPRRGRGGDLGWFSPGDLMAPLNETAFSLPVGKISPPIRTPSGFHILLVEEKETELYQPFDSVKREIRQTLTDQKTEAVLQEWFKNLRVQSYVEIKL